MRMKMLMMMMKMITRTAMMVHGQSALIMITIMSMITFNEDSKDGETMVLNECFTIYCFLVLCKVMCFWQWWWVKYFYATTRSSFRSISRYCNHSWHIVTHFSKPHIATFLHSEISGENEDPLILAHCSSIFLCHLGCFWPSYSLLWSSKLAIFGGHGQFAGFEVPLCGI